MPPSRRTTPRRAHLSLRSRLEALVAAAPDDANVPVRWLREILAEEAPDASVYGETAVAIDFTVLQLAERFGRASSTIRTWCESGQLPGSYRLNGREWRIPLAAAARCNARRHRDEHRRRISGTRSRLMLVHGDDTSRRGHPERAYVSAACG